MTSINSGENRPYCIINEVFRKRQDLPCEYSKDFKKALISAVGYLSTRDI